jgi:hypothetical protein
MQGAVIILKAARFVLIFTVKVSGSIPATHPTLKLSQRPTDLVNYVPCYVYEGIWIEPTSNYCSVFPISEGNAKTRSESFEEGSSFK